MASLWPITAYLTLHSFHFSRLLSVLAQSLPQLHHLCCDEGNGHAATTLAKCDNYYWLTGYYYREQVTSGN